MDVGYVRVGDNSEGDVFGVVSIKISHLEDIIEVYSIDGLKHNLLGMYNYVMLNWTYFLLSSDTLSYMQQKILYSLVIEIRISMYLILLI